MAGFGTPSKPLEWGRAMFKPLLSAIPIWEHQAEGVSLSIISWEGGLERFHPKYRGGEH